MSSRKRRGKFMAVGLRYWINEIHYNLYDWLPEYKAPDRMSRAAERAAESLAERLRKE